MEMDHTLTIIIVALIGACRNAVTNDGIVLGLGIHERQINDTFRMAATMSELVVNRKVCRHQELVNTGVA